MLLILAQRTRRYAGVTHLRALLSPRHLQRKEALHPSKYLSPWIPNSVSKWWLRIIFLSVWQHDGNSVQVQKTDFFMACAEPSTDIRTRHMTRGHNGDSETAKAEMPNDQQKLTCLGWVYRGRSIVSFTSWWRLWRGLGIPNQHQGGISPDLGYSGNHRLDFRERNINFHLRRGSKLLWGKLRMFSRSGSWGQPIGTTPSTRRQIGAQSDICLCFVKLLKWNDRGTVTGWKTNFSSFAYTYYIKYPTKVGTFRNL